jgi:hypothetical protein
VPRLREPTRQPAAEATIATEHQYAAHSTRSRSAAEGTQHVSRRPNKR